MKKERRIDMENYEIKDSGSYRTFETGAIRDDGGDELKGRYDLLPWNAIEAVAVHCQKGAKKYGENNVRKGLPAWSLYDSAMRHLNKWFRGWNDEDHLVSAAWNILWLLEQRTTHPELDTIHGEKRNIVSVGKKRPQAEK